MVKIYPFNVRNSLFEDDIYVSWAGHDPVKIPPNSAKIIKVETSGNPRIYIETVKIVDLNKPAKFGTEFEYNLKRQKNILDMELIAGTAANPGGGAAMGIGEEEPETTVEIGAPQ